MVKRGDVNVSKILKQPLVLILLLSAFSQQVMAQDAPQPESTAAAAPAEAPVQLGWDRVGDRERNWV
jgi:hypothetical protein